ncbi:MULTISPECIES: cytoskeleton protein RodZ [unclassified Vibrio]|uniref:Cytoskeleton protein RodZ n=1 Tax=Vibrio sp. HB236076 TaxID=3232307 RepID=A0AB39HD89_9VIBR|nr:cytoskeleton protein RodZ [Vibrio sp. HB161653]MDP5254092.1 cytoskeleton protein RodZ [Vibrio sp. HB161653]
MTTETEQKTESSHEGVTRADTGILLRQKRESLGLTKQQVADRLRLRVTVIEQIEANHYESQKVATFIRGYVRNYARLVGLDENQVLDSLSHFEHVQHKPQEMQSFSGKTKQAKHNSRIMWVTGIIFIIILGISSLWWLQNQQNNSLTENLNQAISEGTNLSALEPEVSEPVSPVSDLPAASDESSTEALTDTDAPAETSPASLPSTTVADNQGEPVAESAPIATADVAAVATQNAVSEPQAPVTVKSQNLVMDFSDDCWVQIKDASGKTLLVGLQEAGKQVDLSGEKPFQVVLGAPEAVNMTFASEPIDLSRYTAGKVARFTLP